MTESANCTRQPTPWVNHEHVDHTAAGHDHICEKCGEAFPCDRDDCNGVAPEARQYARWQLRVQLCWKCHEATHGER